MGTRSWRIATFGDFQASERGGGEEGDFSVPRADPGSPGGGVAPVRPFTNVFTPRVDGNRIHPRFGLGISVGVHTVPSNGRPSTVTFFGAAWTSSPAEFEDEEGRPAGRTVATR